MSCGCKGSGPSFHPSDSYHFQGGGGIGSPPPMPGYDNDDVPIVSPGPDQSGDATSSRAPSSAGSSSPCSCSGGFPWGWVLVAAIAWFILKGGN